MFIKSKVWGSASGKRLLTKKLVNRWMTVEVRSEEVGTMEPESLVCNDRYIFCGHENGIVDVFSIASGDFARRLFPDKNVAGEVGERRCVKGIALMLPYLVVFPEREAQQSAYSKVNVYKMFSGASTGRVIKSVSVESSPRYEGVHRFISNNLLLGGENGDTLIHLFEKASLVEEKRTAKTSHVFLPAIARWANMNT